MKLTIIKTPPIMKKRYWRYTERDRTEAIKTPRKKDRVTMYRNTCFTYISI